MKLPALVDAAVAGVDVHDRARGLALLVGVEALVAVDGDRAIGLQRELLVRRGGAGLDVDLRAVRGRTARYREAAAGLGTYELRRARAAAARLTGAAENEGAHALRRQRGAERRAGDRGRADARRVLRGAGPVNTLRGDRAAVQVEAERSGRGVGVGGDDGPGVVRPERQRLHARGRAGQSVSDRS